MEQAPWHRKKIRLSEYDYSEKGAYFVTFCTKNRNAILSHITSGESPLHPPEVHLTDIGTLVESCVLQIPARYPGVNVDSYAIMPNHVHLLIRFTTENCPKLGQIVQQLKGAVTKQCGIPIWQEKYYDHVIRDETDYLTKYQYIQNNPASWLEDEYYIP